MPNSLERLSRIIEEKEPEILREWINLQLTEEELRTDVLKEAEVKKESKEFLSLLGAALKRSATSDFDAGEWDEVRGFLEGQTRSRVKKGLSPTENALFTLALKQPLIDELRESYGDDWESLSDEIWNTSMLFDRLGLYTNQIYIESREQIIARQQQELMELSTPVVQLWDEILALPLIGTLDSSRAQVVTESLLEEIVRTGASIAIIDITGVPTVDTLVAQHLLKTIAAAKLMGAECIISGIRPQIAQTIVHLGVDLGTVVTKSSISDAFTTALKKVGYGITRIGG